MLWRRYDIYYTMYYFIFHTILLYINVNYVNNMTRLQYENKNNNIQLHAYLLGEWPTKWKKHSNSLVRMSAIGKKALKSCKIKCCYQNEFQRKTWGIWPWESEGLLLIDRIWNMYVHASQWFSNIIFERI